MKEWLAAVHRVELSLVICCCKKRKKAMEGVLKIIFLVQFQTTQ